VIKDKSIFNVKQKSCEVTEFVILLCERETTYIESPIKVMDKNRWNKYLLSVLETALRCKFTEDNLSRVK
jgi:hypothetical protein